MVILDWNETDTLGDTAPEYWTSLVWTESSAFLEVPRRLAVFGRLSVTPWVGVGAITIDEET